MGGVRFFQTVKKPDMLAGDFDIKILDGQALNCLIEQDRVIYGCYVLNFG